MGFSVRVWVERFKVQASGAQGLGFGRESHFAAPQGPFLGHCDKANPKPCDKANYMQACP